MRKTLLTGLLLTSGLFAAQARVELLPPPQRVPQKAEVTRSAETNAAEPRTATPEAVPASIVGKRYVTFFRSFTNYGDAAAWIVVEQAGGDSVLLRGLVDGYSLTARYDNRSGRLTIPVGRVVGRTQAGADITVHNLLASFNYTKFNDSPVMATVEGTAITFDNGFLAVDPSGSGYAFMAGVTAREANGTLRTNNIDFTTLQPGTAYEYPVLVTKTAADTVVVQGMANWLYGHNYKVPFGFDAATASLATADSVDWYKSGDEVRSCHMLYRPDDNENSVALNPRFSVAATADSTVILNQKILFEGFQKAGADTWSGWLLNPFELRVGFNIHTAPVASTDTAADFEAAGILYRTNPETLTALVTGCTDTLTDLAIPATVQYMGRSYTVNKIGKNAFMNRKAIVSATIPATVIEIGSAAFIGLSNLRTLHLPPMEKWCRIVFGNVTACPIFNVFPSDSAKWGKVYVDGQELLSVNVPEGVATLSSTFYGFRALRSVTFPSTLRAIDTYCFQYCERLTSLTFPQGLKSIATGAFSSCKGLTAVDIPGTVEEIGGSAFSSCSALASVTFHTGLKRILASAFSSCSALTEVKLPSTIDTVFSSFGSCRGITKFTCLATVPPGAANDNLFSAFAANCTLYVPNASIAAYSEAKSWRKFKEIQPYTGAAPAVDAADADSHAPARYFTLFGTEVAADRLAPGIYIRLQAGRATKVLVK